MQYSWRDLNERDCMRMTLHKGIFINKKLLEAMIIIVLIYFLIDCTWSVVTFDEIKSKMVLVLNMLCHRASGTQRDLLSPAVPKRNYTE